MHEERAEQIAALLPSCRTLLARAMRVPPVRRSPRPARRDPSTAPFPVKAVAPPLRCGVPLPAVAAALTWPLPRGALRFTSRAELAAPHRRPTLAHRSLRRQTHRASACRCDRLAEPRGLGHSCYPSRLVVWMVLHHARTAHVG